MTAHGKQHSRQQQRLHARHPGAEKLKNCRPQVGLGVSYLKNTLKYQFSEARICSTPALAPQTIRSGSQSALRFWHHFRCTMS